MKRLATAALIAGAVFSTSVSAVWAATLYGVDVDTDQLITIDTTTGVGTAVGPLGLEAVNGLSFDSNGNLYGFNNRGATDLLQIDTATGNAVSVGEDSDAAAVNGLAFAANDALYGTSVGGMSNFYTFDPVTAEATLIGPMHPTAIAGLAFHPSDTLYGADIHNDQLVTIDTLTGLTTIIGALGFNAVQGLAFDANGVLYGVDTDTDQLLTINLTTGLATAIGSLGFGTVAGLAFEPAPVPLPATLPLLMSALGFFGYFGWCRKRIAVVA